MPTNNRSSTNRSSDSKRSSTFDRSAQGVASSANGIGYPYHPLIKMPGQAHNVCPTTTPPPAARSDSSKAESRTLKLSQAQWEQVSEDIEKYMADDTNYVVDCFINAQESMAELEQAIRKTAHRENLDAGVKAANNGLDCLGSDLFRIIKRTIDELSASMK